MLNGVASETVFLCVALALPVALLATLLALLWARMKARKKIKKPPVAKILDASPPLITTLATAIEETSTKPMHIDIDLHKAARTPAAIETHIETAKVSGQVTMLAGLYLELARARFGSGDEAGALAALRSAAGLGAQHGPKSAHALARLELADAAYRAGDLTSACEQWQLARTAFQEDGRVNDSNRIDKLMRDHGCPTDWVLTDF